MRWLLVLGICCCCAALLLADGEGAGGRGRETAGRMGAAGDDGFQVGDVITVYVTERARLAEQPPHVYRIKPRVVELLANGNLRIEFKHSYRRGDGRPRYEFSGIVRPEDLLSGGVVCSEQVWNLEILKRAE